MHLKKKKRKGVRTYGRPWDPNTLGRVERNPGQLDPFGLPLIRPGLRPGLAPDQLPPYPICCISSLIFRSS